MKTYCPVCETETNQEFIQKIESINVRGEQIPVDVEYYHCNGCGQEYEHPHPGYDALDQAFHIYRQRKGLLQPEVIKGFRKKLRLTQKELSKILGIGIATLNRYENGAIQTESHDQNIRFCMNPLNLLAVINNKSDLFSKKKMAYILESLNSTCSGSSDLIKVGDSVNYNSQVTYKSEWSIKGINWPGLPDSVLKALLDAGMSDEAGKLDEQLFSVWFNQQSEKISIECDRRDFDQALAKTEHLTSVLSEFSKLNPIINSLFHFAALQARLLEKLCVLNEQLLEDQLVKTEVRKLEYDAIAPFLEELFADMDCEMEKGNNKSRPLQIAESLQVHL